MLVQSVQAAADDTRLSARGPLSSLGSPAAHPLMAISILLRRSPGDTLFVEGGAADHVYETVRGMVRLYKLLPDGRRLITGFLAPGHLFGFAPEGAYVYTAEPINDATVFRYPRAALERLIDEVPDIARRLISLTCQELRQSQDRMLLLGRKSAAEKVASFLILMALQQDHGHRDRVDIPMPRTDIADYLGLTNETVCRTLSRLKRRGLITLRSANLIELRDRDRLEELAIGDADETFEADTGPRSER